MRKSWGGKEGRREGGQAGRKSKKGIKEDRWTEARKERQKKD